MPELSPTLLGALRLFVDELKKHVEFIDRVFAAKEHSPEISEKEMKALEARFHTIKGGAGFLQLAELQQVSGDAEKFFKSKPTNEALRRFVEVELPGIRSAIDKVRAASQKQLETP